MRTIFCRKGSKGEPCKEAIIDPGGSSETQHQPAVQAGESEPVGILLLTSRDRRGDAGDDARD